ncbi:MAG: DUF308 domain-containing protein [Flavobacteriia bacterium]|nr:DUF308 domain-containing protein [Flavobacteriia bacterium]OJX38523.1 MAG: hypothetical protein BGO87_10425 [Flavobacteriia bacterium 40-80]
MATIMKSLTNTVKHWYIPLVIGIIFIFLGIYSLTVPLATYLTLATLFSLSFIASGLFDIVFSLQNSKNLHGWGWYLVSGILTLLIGIYLFILPPLSVGLLPYFVGFTVLFRSFQLLGFAFDLKELRFTNWGNVALVSIGGIILSILLLINPVFTGFSLVTLTGLAFLVAGISSVILAFSLRKLKNYPDKLSNELKHKIKTLQEEIDEHLK